MTRVESLQAKTHFAALLKRVQKGEKILITKRGRPLAMLAPPPEPRRDIKGIIAQMRALRCGNTLQGLTIR